MLAMDKLYLDVCREVVKIYMFIIRKQPCHLMSSRVDPASPILEMLKDKVLINRVVALK